jgi:ribosome-binding ATPase YchF (GTP1/OBG family)
MPKLEMEIAQLDEQEAAFFMREYSLKESSLSLLIRSAYAMLSLRSFFTVSADEVREWSIKAGTNARQAAGIIHTDMETGFIRAEVIAFDDLQQMGSEAAVKSAGKWRLEGKDYPVQDGDIIKVRFSPPTRK